ncbi:hypothetical protein HRbin17_01316 [bacterium HR17]|uniref:Periplasmic heavy metal sensor n=1 Tax=Candidatus Fervidibacter japonicus TaxID=2035412 RepID=A0A2H5XC82_9BACT|nr:hypothetical protein HRbin17_01316 [bacterium HR17]
MAMKWQKEPKPLWLRTGIGPGTIVMLVLLAFVLWQRWHQTRPVAPLPSSTQKAHSLAPLPREPKWLLERADELGLTDEQWEKLRALQRSYEQRTAALHQRLDKVSKDFQRFMDEAQRKRRAMTVQEIQQRAADLSSLSRLMAQERKAVWEQALMVLTEKQRKRIDESSTPLE